MAKKLYEESNIAAIATAIRSKNGMQDTYLVSEMASAIGDIDSGGTDVSDATALAGDVKAGSTAYIATGKVTGTMPNLDNIEFGSDAVVLNPGYTNPQYYEAIVDAINYVKEYGGNEPVFPALPSEYQEVEYIEFTPPAMFLVTIPLYGLFEISIVPYYQDSELCAFGYRFNTGTNAEDFEFATFTLGNTGAWARDYLYMPLYCADQTWSADKTFVIKAIMSHTRGSAHIGGYGSYNESIMKYAFKGKINYLKVTNPIRNTAIAKYLPVYRKADNVVGFYELVGGTFYSSITGSGSVTAGPDVT